MRVPVTLLPPGTQYHNCVVPSNFRLAVLDNVPPSLGKRATSDLIPDCLRTARQFLSGVHLQEFENSFQVLQLRDFKEIICLPTNAIDLCGAGTCPFCLSCPRVCVCAYVCVVVCVLVCV